MIAVIFEVEPRAGHEQRYFEIAADLRPLLEQVDGFISVERFESLTTKGRYLSLSFWRDEDAVRRWRNQPTHRAGQQEGRNLVFDDYRLRAVGTATTASPMVRSRMRWRRSRWLRSAVHTSVHGRARSGCACATRAAATATWPAAWVSICSTHCCSGAGFNRACRATR